MSYSLRVISLIFLAAAFGTLAACFKTTKSQGTSPQVKESRDSNPELVVLCVDKIEFLHDGSGTVGISGHFHRNGAGFLFDYQMGKMYSQFYDAEKKPLQDVLIGDVLITDAFYTSHADDSSFYIPSPQFPKAAMYMSLEFGSLQSPIEKINALK